MPLQRESLIKIYRANRRLGGGRPVIVATGDTTREAIPFGEFYIFHEFPDLPFLFSRTRCAHSDDMFPFDFGQYPEVFSAKALLESEFRAARDRIEYEIFQRDRALCRDLFWSASPLVFEETDDLPLIEFQIFQLFTKERATMFDFSRSHTIRLLKDKLQQLPAAILHHEPKA
jgi:hypothetical protein